MTQVFISYSTQDAMFAKLAKFELGERGVSAWLDSGELQGGEEWRISIDRGIAQSDVVLVVLTQASCASAYVTYEWGYALGRNKMVIPLLREECDIHPRLEILQHLDFRDDRNSPWSALAEQIENAAAAQEDGGDDAQSIGQMSAQDLQDLVASSVALALATAKSSGHASAPEDFSKAAVTVSEAVSQTKSRDSSKRRKRVLWVDDRPDNNAHEREAFEALGVEFTLALSTHEALEILGSQSFSAVISDMGRKEGPREGYVLLEKLRASDSSTPFFIYAGSNAPEHKREAKRRGAQGSTNSPQELFDLLFQCFRSREG